MLNNIIQYFQDASTYQVLDLVGTIIGLIYIYQEYKASIWLWLTSVLMPIVYSFVYCVCVLWSILVLLFDDNFIAIFEGKTTCYR